MNESAMRVSPAEARAEPDREAGAIARHSARIDGNLADVDHAVSRLEKALGTVLRPDDPVKLIETSNDPEPMSDLGGITRRQADRLGDMAQRIHTLVNRLDV